MAPSSSSSLADLPMFAQPRHQRVRLPNELLHELAQCMPMAWFVGGGSEQQRQHGIVQLGTAMGTYLAQAGTKFAAVAKRRFVDLMSDQPESPPPTFQETFPADGNGPLPVGWVLIHKANGRRYFCNVITEESTYDDPRTHQPKLAPSDKQQQDPDPAPEEASGSKQTRKVKKYTVEEKVDMMDYAEEVGNTAAGEEFGGVDESTIRGWRKKEKEDKLREKAETTPGCTQYFERVHAELIGAIDNDLVAMIGDVPNELSDWRAIAAKAKELWKERVAQDETMKETDMNITLGWVSRFMRRNGQRVPKIPPPIIRTPTKMSTSCSGPGTTVREAKSKRAEAGETAEKTGGSGNPAELIGESGGPAELVEGSGGPEELVEGSGGPEELVGESGGPAELIGESGGPAELIGESGGPSGMAATECTGARKRKCLLPMKFSSTSEPSPKQQKGGDEEKQQTQ